jgi:hypothetical protein
MAPSKKDDSIPTPLNCQANPVLWRRQSKTQKRKTKDDGTGPKE